MAISNPNSKWSEILNMRMRSVVNSYRQRAGMHLNNARSSVLVLRVAAVRRSPGAYPGINQRRPAADDDGMNGCGFYELLGLTHKASAQEIRASYRKLAKVCHPDKSSGDPEVFSRLQHAFEVLIDPAQRKVYDHQVLWSDKDHFETRTRLSG
eukprot:gene13368-19215_t